MHYQSDINPDQDRRKVTDYEEYWNSQFKEKPILVGIMEYGISDKDDEMLITTVGRGIAICMNDKELQMGGLAHILMPYNLTKNHQAVQEKIAELINPIVEFLISNGSNPETIKAKLFGCGQLSSDDKEENAKLIYCLVREYLSQNHINITMEDMGRTVGRRIHFFPKNGKAVRRLLQRQIDRNVLIEREDEFNQNY